VIQGSKTCGLKRFPLERTQDACHSLSSVIAGLDPAIHLLRKSILRGSEDMDPRVKPAGDAREWASAESMRTGH
jgi:hypothetical protein